MLYLFGDENDDISGFCNHFIVLFSSSGVIIYEITSERRLRLKIFLIELKQDLLKVESSEGQMKLKFRADI